MLRGRRATSYPGVELPSARTSTEGVVEDGNILTSRGPATAMDFALALATRARGAKAAASVRQDLLAN